MSEWEDRLAIRELTARYNQAIDEGRPEEWAATFTADGVFESPSRNPLRGRDALLEFARTRAAGGARTRHFTTDAIIEIDGDTARQTCYLLLLDTSQGVKIKNCGVYVDRLTRTPEGWRFSHRRVALEDGPRPSR